MKHKKQKVKKVEKNVFKQKIVTSNYIYRFQLFYNVRSVDDTYCTFDKLLYTHL